MAKINSFHLQLNEAKAKKGLNVSENDIEVELYTQHNLIVSTDPTLLTSDYEKRIRMLTEINENLEQNLQKKRHMLALLTEASSPRTEASRSEPRRSARLRNQKKKSLNNSFFYY